MEQRIEIVVGPDGHKCRLDEYLFNRFGGLSKMYLRRAVKEEKCEVNGRLENVGYRLRSNDLIEIELDLTRETAMRPQDIPLEIVYEDAHLIVVNKAPGMLVHPTHRDKSGTLLNALTFYLNRKVGSDIVATPLVTQRSGTIRPGLIHRLDKETSGLIVVSKNAKAHKRMMESFRRKSIAKRYVALVEGLVNGDMGVINAPIGRYGELKHWDVKLGGKPAETRFKVLNRNDDLTLVELEPVTGRTNQLRIHMASSGHPIVGDHKRGGRAHSRLCLHAWKLIFAHPITRETLSLAADPPRGFLPFEDLS
ncbi:MAG TPA: RluA family pseudouridine synthase [Pyrinomonadaceae bacterium]|nr:RluA family pseudouridine synthase [Pyrinomonadaceae bacterium]HMP65213.1 RluA family pseudouridine synthase [Pyrinomonadaceae bacterium]